MKVNEKEIRRGREYYVEMEEGVTLRNRKRTAELMDCSGVVRGVELVSHGRLRWYGLRCVLCRVTI